MLLHPWLCWLRDTLRSFSPRRLPAAPRRPRARPRLDPLEDRCLPALALPAGFTETLVTQDVRRPTAMAFAPDGRLFVTEQDGRLQVIHPGQTTASTVLRVNVNNFAERGLVGVALDPKFATNRYVYVYYTQAAPVRNRVSRFTLSATNPDVADPASETVILTNIPAGGNGFHNGGAMHFGPDGKLYVAVGDADFKASAQSLATLTGKILRLDPAAYPHVVPRDNPFGHTPGARKQIWALGFRNPFSFAFAPGPGGVLFANDVGENAFEEIDRVVRGGNYGWPVNEGFGGGGFRNPVFAYAHGGPGGPGGPGGAIAGGAFYYAGRFPAQFQGSYFFTDFVHGFIDRLPARNRGRRVHFARGAQFPVGLEVGPDGRLYYLSYTAGAVYAIGFTGSANRPPAATASASPAHGGVPLTVTFSAAGSSDPDGDPLRFVWDFGDKSPAAEGAAVTHTYAQASRFTARLTVLDSRGGTTQADPLLITPGNFAPTADLVLPLVGLRVRRGRFVTFAGSGSDPEDGPLPDSAFSWTIELHHNTHVHPFLGPIPGVRSGSFRIPRRLHGGGILWYRVLLTVTDSQGVAQTVFRDVFLRR